MYEQYVKDGAAARQLQGAVEASKWGSEDAFYRLTKTCLEHTQSGYMYKVCPFGLVEQIDVNGSHKRQNLGTVPSFTRLRNENVVTLSGGDVCHGVGSRSTEVCWLGYDT